MFCNISVRTGTGANGLWVFYHTKIGGVGQIFELPPPGFMTSGDLN